MQTNPSLSAETLGQIALVQSMVAHLPDKENILRFVCRGLIEVPGVDKVDYCIYGDNVDQKQPFVESQGTLQKIIIKVKDYKHGELLFSVSDIDSFSPYIPFIENLGNMLAVIFEERRQRSLNTSLLENLEQRIYERTKELEIEIEERKQAEIALRASEERFSKSFESFGSGMAMTALDGRFLLVNSALCEMLNYTREELLAKSFRDVTYLDDAEKSLDYLQELVRGKINSFEDEKRYIRKDGSIFWASIKVSSVKNSRGGLQHFFTHVSDITERKQAEDTLRESEENLRITLNSIGDAVISTNTDGNITRMNPVAETLTGWKQKEALGKPLTDVFYIINDKTRKLAENPVEKVLKAGNIVGLANHTVLVARDGTEHQIADSGAPIRDAKGNIIGVVLVFRDVTEQLRTSQELLKVKKLEAVGILAGGIAHDFNNLLTGLFGNIEMAKMSLHVDHKSYEYLEAAGRSMDSAVNLTKQLLTFAKGGDPIKETLSIGDALIETAKFSTRGSNVRLQTSIAPDLWLVEADKGQLSQVISNLVINAQQSMQTWGTITVAAKNVETSEGRYVQIIVQDEGAGIAPQYLDKIFDPYFTTKEKGNGLGLATTHSIISKHKGRITVDSHLNQGTTFTLFLPAAKKTEEKTAGKLSVTDHTATAFSARILVMDDEEGIREVIRAMLGKMGHEVSYAVNGQEAIAKYRISYEKGTPYDVVITDLTIPGGMGGQSAAQEILKINPQAKIIVSSGYATDPVMANYKMYGFKGIAVKPYRFVDLQNVVQQVLEM